jgi:hypothetical protein
MKSSSKPSAVNLDAATRAAWQSQLASAVRAPGLVREMVRRREELLPRFAAHYGRLRRSPRRARRLLKLHRGVSLAAVALLLALAGGVAHAATIDATGGCTLADAIRAANTDAASGACPAGNGDDTITLASGSTHTFTRADDTTYGPTALPLVTSTITIAGNDSTIRRAPGSDAFRLLTVSPTGDLTLQDTTVTGGSVPDRTGGGVYNYAGMLTLTGSTISGNSAYYGGGVGSFAGWTTATDCTVSGNQALEGGGGLFTGDGVIVLAASSVTGNTAAAGGGIGGYGYRGAVNVLSSTVSGNTADDAEGGGYGGGVAIFKSSVSIVDSTVSGNVARGGGGGLATYLSPNAVIDGGTLSGNSSANYGGGVDNYRSSLVVFNSTISGNGAAHGGGISNEGERSSVFARFNTISSNTATETGGGVYASSPILLGRSLVSGNTAVEAGPEVYSTPGNNVYADDFNLFGQGGVSGVVGLPPSGTNVTPSGPLGSILAPSLADNGGPTLTLALVPGSPAVDAVPAGDSCFPDDQRGVARPQGAACDIGAFEGTAGGAGAEICGNCFDDDGDGRIDLADSDCAASSLASEKGSLVLKPDPSSDQVTLTATFPAGGTFNPRVEGATVSFSDAASQLVCVRIPSEATAPRAWKESAGKKSTTWRFKDAKDGSLGDPTKDTFNAKCEPGKGTCTVKLKVKRANVGGDGAARRITTGVVIGDDAWKREQAWESKAKGTKLVTP